MTRPGSRLLRSKCPLVRSLRLIWGILADRGVNTFDKTAEYARIVVTLRIFYRARKKVYQEE